MLHAVIMAGGSGTRFWPQSRQKLPKQLLRLAGERTMIQQTLDRCSGLINHAQSWVVTNETQVGQTRLQLPELPPENVLIEPQARNTAPCVGLAAIHAMHDDPDAIMFIMPADHVIAPVEVFQDAARRAIAVVQAAPERLVLFGVTPDFPATGYGYIERGAQLQGSDGVFDVKAFREKPELAVAEEYVASGNFYWTCGIFCWKASTILQHLKAFEPDTWQRLQAIDAAIGTDGYDAALTEHFPLMNSISIDFAVLEKASGVTVIEAPYSWDDVGSWLAVPRLAGTDAQGNTADGQVTQIDTKNCIIRTSDQHHVAALGVEDLIIVHTPDATLVAHRKDSERIKEILAELKQQGRTELL